MPCTIIPELNAIVCSFTDNQTYVIMVRGRRYRFEWSDRFGPLRVNKDGRTSQREWPLYVIDAICNWVKRGKRHNAGTCIPEDNEE